MASAIKTTYGFKHQLYRCSETLKIFFSCGTDIVAEMERGQENTTTHQNHSNFWNDTAEGVKQPPDHASTNISLGLGTCITLINVTVLFFLLRHRKSIDETGFWQQLVFLCFTDILTGLAISLPPFGFLFFDIHADIYYSFCALGIFIFPLSFTLSLGNCFIISVYRYVILRYIDKPNTKLQKYSSPLMIVGNILLSLVTIGVSVLVVSVLFGFQYKEFCDNVNATGQNKYKSMYIMGSVIISTVFLTGTNVLTILSIVRVKNMNKIQPTTSSEHSLNIVKRIRTAAVTFIIIVIVLNLSIIPTLLFLIVSMSNKVNVSTDTTEIISRIVCLNSLLNPIIYSLRSTTFRIAVWKDIKAVLSRIRCSPEAP